MPKVNWMSAKGVAHENERVIVVPKTPDFERPYASRVPTPPKRKANRQAATMAPPPPKTKARSNPILLGITIAVVSAFTISAAAYWVLSQDYQPSEQDRQAIDAKLANAKLIAEETPAEFIDSMVVSSVRLASDQTRANINGEIYRVGDLIDEMHGIVLVGHDPDGEFLLFQDNEKQTHFYPLYQANR